MSTPKSPTGANFTKTIHNTTYPFISPLKTNLTAHSVLITGASRGIGAATALSFAQAGFSRIAICSRSSLACTASKIREAAKEAGRPAPEILEIRLDVTDLASVTEAASLVREAFGAKLDVLVSNAGYLEAHTGGILESEPLELRRSWDVNLQGTYLVTRAFLPLILNSTLKTIVGVTSIGAHLPSYGFPAYQTAKLAMLRLMEFVSEENKGRGVVAFCVHPGAVDTELARNAMPEGMRGLLVDSPVLSGDAICWLGSERREWLGGRYVSATWDMEEIVGMREEIVGRDLLKVGLRVD